MGVIRRDQNQAVTPFKFGEGPAPKAPAKALVFEDLTPRRAPPPPEPAPAPVAAPPPPPPPPPVFEVPEQLVTAIYEDAVLRGLEEGKQQVMAELTVLQERYAGALDQLDAVSRQLVDRNRITLISLACRVAERLVRHHLSLHPDHLLNMVREVLNELEDRDEVVVHCSSQDYEFLAGRRTELAAGLGETFRIQVLADETLEYGDFRVETRTGSADGRVTTRLDEVKEALLGTEGDDGQP